MTSYRYITRYCLVLVVVATSMLVSAQTRTWLKYHMMAEIDGNVLAEFTSIMTHDEQSPHQTRMLYQDDQAERLVIRQHIDIPSSYSLTSITSVSSGDSVTVIVDDGDGEVTIGSQSIQFTDQEPLSASDKAAALALLQGNASQGMQDALYRLARTAAYVGELGAVEHVLRELFFHELSGSGNDYTTDPTAVVRPFDPAIAPPSSFDSQFGQAYFQ